MLFNHYGRPLWKNSRGHDGISSKLVKDLKNEIVLPLSIMINTSIESGRACAWHQRSYSYAKTFISAPSPRDLNEVTPSGGMRARQQ